MDNDQPFNHVFDLLCNYTLFKLAPLKIVAVHQGLGLLQT
jgi:hypothetical protein